MTRSMTQRLIKNTIACTATLSLTMGLVGPAATCALADTIDSDGIQVVGEAPAADAQGGSGQESVVDPNGGIEPVAHSTTSTNDMQADTLDRDTEDPKNPAQDDNSDPEGMRKGLEELDKASDKKGDFEKKDGSDKKADNDRNSPITYIDENGVEQTITDYTDLSDAKVEDKEGYGLRDGWYIVRNSRTFAHRLTVTGDAKLILCDGATAYFKTGIRGYSGKLTVYGQRGQSGTLKVEVEPASGNAAIGGNKGEGDNARLCFCGGIVKADATNSGGVYAWDKYGAAGIGTGVKATDRGDITISGGNVTGKGGRYGAGIGSGYEAAGCPDITITGGEVTARGTNEGGAGIGGGNHVNASNITISGGKIMAVGADAAAGIGGGNCGGAGNITISDGDVTAISESDYHLNGAAIGTGDEGAGGNVAITGGKVNAESKGNGAGIGTGGSSKGLVAINISGGDVTARARNNAAGIGGGACADGCPTRISGGTVRAYGGDERGPFGKAGAGIGGGRDGNGPNLVVTGGTIEATGGKNGSAVGHGEGGKLDGNVTLPADYMVSGSHEPGGEVVRAHTPERRGYLKYRRYAKIEACDHAHSKYKQVEGGHTLSCENCEHDASKVMPHEYDEHGVCTKCGFEKPAPKFAATTIDAAGKIGPTFWFHMPKGADVKVDKVELSIGGKHARTETHSLDDAQRDGRGFYGFHMDATSIEMSEPVKCVVTYDGGEKVEATTTVEELIKEQVKGDNKDGVGVKPAKTKLLKSLANLGHYEQPWLADRNGWKMGEDYIRTELHLADLNKVDEAAEALKAYTAGVTEGKEHIAKMMPSVRMDASSTLNIYFTPKKGESFGACTAMMAGHDATCEVEKDGRLHVSVPGLTAADYDKSVEVSGTCGDGSFKANASILGYCNAAMTGYSTDQQAREALSSVYWYFNYAKDIVNEA